MLHTSVLSMFVAQLLDSMNNKIGLNVDYTHRCAKCVGTGNVAIDDCSK